MEARDPIGSQQKLSESLNGSEREGP